MSGRLVQSARAPERRAKKEKFWGLKRFQNSGYHRNLSRFPRFRGSGSAIRSLTGVDVEANHAKTLPWLVIIIFWCGKRWLSSKRARRAGNTVHRCAWDAPRRPRCASERARSRWRARTLRSRRRAHTPRARRVASQDVCPPERVWRETHYPPSRPLGAFH